MFTKSLITSVRRAGIRAPLGRAVHIEARIAQLGLTLPAAPPAPKGNYMNYSREGNILYLSGHLPQQADGSLIKGRLGENMTVEQGQAAAKVAALNILASVKAACGDLDNVKRILRVSGFINSANDFTSQPMVLNGCSDLFGEIFGVEVARHARSALGVNILPLGVAVEIEAIIELK